MARRTPTIRRALWVVAFVALVVVGDRAGAFGLHRAVMSTENRFAVMYRGQAEADVLIVGNSRGMNSFHAPTLAQALGRPVFNLSYNGLSTELAEALVLDYLDRNPAPKLVIVEVSGVVSGNGVIRDLLPFAAESARLDALADRVLPSTPQAARRAFGLYSYNGEMLVRSLAAGRASDQEMILEQAIPEGLIRSIASDPPVRFRPLDANLRALGALVDALQARDIAVRLVVAPYFPAYRAKVEGYTAFLQTLETAAGTRVWDLSDAVTQTDGFADRVHLNRVGAGALVPVLAERGFFDGLPARGVSAPD